MGLEGFSVTFDPRGDLPLEFSPRAESLRWSTLAVGGFGSCSFSIPGIEAHKRIDYLTPVRVTLGPRVIYEGRVEDKGLRLGAETIESSFECFGWKRALDDTSVLRIWSERDLRWQQVTNRSTLGVAFNPGAVTIAEGLYEPTDLTKRGLKLFGADGSFGGAAGYGDGRTLKLPDTITLERWKGSYANTQALMLGTLFRSDTGSSWSVIQTYGNVASGTFDHDLSANAVTQIAVTYETDGINQPGPGDYFEVYDMRLLCTSLNEDASGGFYGGTILRDLIGLVPDLASGVIEAGSDFTIEQMSRAVRSAALSVVEEVAGYYEREWGVWEDRKFHWRETGRDNPHWVVRLDDCDSLDITGSVEGLAKTVYVLFPDAAAGRDSEESASATSQANPYVKQGVTKDDIASSGFPMTSNTAAGLAAQLAHDRGRYPSVTGRVVIPATRELEHVDGRRAPAYYLRGGENLVFPELPDDDPFHQGRDGQTLFHVSSAEVNLSDGTVTLELEGQTRSTDVLLARLAHVTRVITG